MKKALPIVAAALGISALTACGNSSTATNESTSTPVVATSASAPASSSSSSEQSSPSPSTTARANNPAAGGAAAAPAPQAPVEVSGVPTAERPANEKAFLAQLGEQGINVDGIIADQVVASARRHCEMERTGQPDLITPAVAGQLIELERTTLSPQQAESLIIQSAQENFCN